MIITEGALQYLVAQRGALDDMRAEPLLWCEKYRSMLEAEMDSIARQLPESAKTILDVGGGMSGISALLNDHFGGDCEVSILDGLDDPPAMQKHSATFSNIEVAREFLKANGVKWVRAIDPKNLPDHAPEFFDLVISQQSWCFHYPPQPYLDFVRTGCISGATKLIIDVRYARAADWMRELKSAFRCDGLIRGALKFDTYGFTAL